MKKQISKVIITSFILFSLNLNAQEANKKLTDFVNPFISTGAVDANSLSGNTFPGATVPFGMVQLSPDTRVNFMTVSGYNYNCAAPFGTDLNAESTGQGMLQHMRNYVNWIDTVFKRYPGLVIENCSCGGMCTDYMMLARHQIQSSSDQTDYKKYPAILIGSMAAVLPEQLAVWSYPLESSDAVETSFNMINAMLCRIHLSGKLDNLKLESKKQVIKGISIYKEKIKGYISQSTPFFPLGMSSITGTTSAIAVGMKSPQKQFLAVWRLTGSEIVSLPVTCKKATVLYPTDLGI